jgi:hypothetical protein
MDPGAQIRALRASFRRLPLKGTKILSEEHKAVHRLSSKTGRLQNQGGGDSRAGSLFLPGVDLL